MDKPRFRELVGLHRRHRHQLVATSLARGGRDPSKTENCVGKPGEVRCRGFRGSKEAKTGECLGKPGER